MQLQKSMFTLKESLCLLLMEEPNHVPHHDVCNKKHLTQVIIVIK